MPSFSVHTLGCKLNQAESEAIALAFLSEGFSAAPWGGDADILIVNTCTVTSKAEQKARRIIRQALKEHPRAWLVVTGCYAQLDAASLAMLDAEAAGRLLVLKGERKAALLELPGRLAAGWRDADIGAGPDSAVTLGDAVGRDTAAGGNAGVVTGAGPDRVVAPGITVGRDASVVLDDLPALLEVAGGTAPGDPFAFHAERSFAHSRPSLKVQDGCDHQCAYCRVRLARGSARSLGAETTLERLRALEEGGAGEAVITGLNIGLYRDGGRDLGALLQFLLEHTERIALRLSSLEPGPELSDGFFEILAENPRIRPHFHLSIQSGSAAVLARMGRRYGPADIAALVARLRAVKDDPFLACDVIAGFPGETPAGFGETLALCESADFAWIHAFPFSRRPGTAAWSMRPLVPESLAVSRVDALTALARRGRAGYVSRWLGRTVEAVFVGGGDGAGSDGDDLPGRAGLSGETGMTGQAAITENYLDILIPDGAGLPGDDGLHDRHGPSAGRGKAGAVLNCRLLPLPPGLARFGGGPRRDALGEPVF